MNVNGKISLKRHGPRPRTLSDLRHINCNSRVQITRTATWRTTMNSFFDTAYLCVFSIRGRSTVVLDSFKAPLHMHWQKADLLLHWETHSALRRIDAEPRPPGGSHVQQNNHHYNGADSLHVTCYGTELSVVVSLHPVTWRQMYVTWVGAC